MAGKLKQEIKQGKPFPSLEEEVFLNLQRTADALLRGLAEVLKPADLTPTQYNALRILRGAGEDGLPCGEVGSRMVTHDPDITRLLDRLERRGLVARQRERSDRRVITARITAPGLAALAELDGPVARYLTGALTHMGQGRLRSLNESLEAARRVRE